MSKININPDLLSLIEETFEGVHEQKKVMLFCLATFADSIDVLYEWGIMQNEQDEYKYRLALMEKDVEVDSLEVKYKLRVPLFVSEEQNDSWDEFYKFLTTNPRLKNMSARFVQKHQGMVGKVVFTSLVNSIKNFDITRLKASTEAYYLREGQYSKNLVSYLDEAAKGQYMGFRRVKSKLI